jgi:hypothetical protein
MMLNSHGYSKLLNKNFMAVQKFKTTTKYCFVIYTRKFKPQSNSVGFSIEIISNFNLLTEQQILGYSSEAIFKFRRKVFLDLP